MATDNTQSGNDKMEYVSSAVFIHTDENAKIAERLQDNEYDTVITPLQFNEFDTDPQRWLTESKHVVVSAPLLVVKKVFRHAMRYNFSIGLIPTSNQKNLTKALELSNNIDSSIELALRNNAQAMDIVLCNGNIVTYKAILGRIPLLDMSTDANRFTAFGNAVRRFIGLKLLKFNFTTANEQKIKSAASGCMIIQHHNGSLAEKLINKDSSARDGAISVIITSPISIIDYLTFLLHTLARSTRSKRLPNGIGYIKSNQIDIESEIELDVSIDGESVTHTPLHCEVIPSAIRINAGAWLEQENQTTQPAKESVRIDNIPDEKEIVKSLDKKIPLFSYASEERFRDLFLSLRDDANINKTYVVMMILSTMLATIGLYLNSSAVIIGAMVLAPLMAPIVSLAMGLLRRDDGLLRNSIQKIAIGILIALFASALVTLLFPHKPLTAEMQARLNPTLLDLAVAIFSGIAAAYSKSFKEIMQSLAGVAIAVALVPPLAVAGVGIGRGDFDFFFQAFLLFSTNLVGIALAATYTFFVLGYSPVVRSKRGVRYVALTLALITIPLYLSYSQFVENLVFEKNLKAERFLVNSKYIIIKSAKLTRRADKKIISMDILAREPLNRLDLNQLKKKIQKHFNNKLIIQTRVQYIL